MKEHRTLKLNKVILVIILIFASAIGFSIPANGGTVYNLTNPMPSVTNLTHVIQGRQSYAGQHIMWKDPQGNMNLINSFGGADVRGDEKAYFHYVNTGTGAHALVEGGACSFGRNSVYDPVHNKFYWYGEYCNRVYDKSFNEFDPVTMTNTVISNAYGYAQLTFGRDNRIYGAFYDSEQKGHIHSYDPLIGPSSLTDYGVVWGKNALISPWVSVDDQYIYVAWQQDASPNYMNLMVHPIGSGTWTELTFGDGLPSDDIRIYVDDATKKYYVYRWAEGAAKYYWLENGDIFPVTGKTPDAGSKIQYNLVNHVSMMSTGNLASFYYTYNYYMNWDYNMPNPANPTSTVSYGPWTGPLWVDGKINVPTSGLSSSTLDYTGPWYDLEVKTVVPHTGSKSFYAIGESISDYNYQNQTSIPVYMRNIPSVYFSTRVPALYSPLNKEEVYILGYPSQFWRWNPSLPWSPDNPKAIALNQHANYRLFADYDAEGKIWVGSNFCGATPGCVDFGTLAWYDPATEAKGEMFQGVWTGGNPPATGSNIKFTNLAMSNNRTKLVVSSNNGKLTVINALTKTIEGEYILGKKAFMVEVANDRVLGITKDGDPSLVFLFQPSTRTMIIEPKSIGVSGRTFAADDGSRNRMQFKLEKGPDGYAWLYVDNKIYRVNPATLAFEYVTTDPTSSNKLIFADNKKDLLVYGKNSASVIPDLLIEAQGFLPADINEDDHVNLADFNILKADFLKLAANLANSRSDINADGQATIKDVGIMMSGWKN